MHMINDNCLGGMRCPECGSQGPFGIGVTAWAPSVSDDGFDVGTLTDIEWDEGSACRCDACGYDGTVADFHFASDDTGQDAAREHPYFTKADWMQDVREGNTVRGYCDWVAVGMERAADDLRHGNISEEEYLMQMGGNGHG